MFYAVRNGQKKGLLTSKTALDKSIKDYPNAEYREFNNMGDAMNYLSGKDIKDKNIPLIVSKPEDKKGDKKLKEEFNPKDKFYAVRVGRQVGIYKTWNECLEQIKHYPSLRTDRARTSFRNHRPRG